MPTDPEIERLKEIEKHWLWIKKKLKLPEDADWVTVYGQMHVNESHAHGYVTYIESYKCDDKQGEIARLTVQVSKLKDQVFELEGRIANALL
jgi:hypothetical protein